MRLNLDILDTITESINKGLEEQKHKNLKTIEECLFASFLQTKLIGSIDDIKLLDYRKCGRTDRGVSAAGNIFSLFLKVNPKDECMLVKRINSQLPDDIVILSYAKIPEDYDIRTRCVSRTYRYFFFSEDLDLEAMRKACKYLEGEHDFKNFCKMKPEYEKSGTIRTIFSCQIKEELFESVSFATNNVLESKFSVCFLEVKGSGFLWHMVNSLDSMHYGNH